MTLYFTDTATGEMKPLDLSPLTSPPKRPPVRIQGRASTRRRYQRIGQATDALAILGWSVAGLFAATALILSVAEYL